MFILVNKRNKNFPFICAFFNVGVKDSSVTLRMTLIIANVNVCVTLNVVEGSFDTFTPTFFKEPFHKLSPTQKKPKLVK